MVWAQKRARDESETSQEMKLFARARVELEPEILDFARARAAKLPQISNPDVAYVA